MMVNYIAIIECDQDKFTEASGRELTHTFTKLKAVMEDRGEFGMWQITDNESLAKFKAALR
jgi:hypothetical protein